MSYKDADERAELNRKLLRCQWNGAVGRLELAKLEELEARVAMQKAGAAPTPEVSMTDLVEPTELLQFKLNTAHTAAVAPGVRWIPIDENTPQGVSLWLISRKAGVSVKGQYVKGEKFFTHWFPNPTFQRPDKQPGQ